MVNDVEQYWGDAEGDVCNRDGCDGVIEFEPVKNCSCHVSPPCGACIDSGPWCALCGWRAIDELAAVAMGAT